jgi:hypothetical protein
MQCECSSVNRAGHALLGRHTRLLRLIIFLGPHPFIRMFAHQEWAKNFDALIGPFEGQYADLKVSIAGIYDEAKDKYVGALQCLVRTTCVDWTADDGMQCRLAAVAQWRLATCSLLS